MAKLMSWRRATVLLGFLLVVGAVYFALRDYLSLAALVAEEERLRTAVGQRPVASWLVGLGVYVAASLIPGTGGKAIIVGWLFGFLSGLMVVNLGLTIAAVVSFLVVRYVFQAAVHRRFGKMIAQIDEALAREGAFYLLTARLLHLPYTLTNYAAAATTVPPHTFWWTTQLGMLPGNVVFVLAGAQMPTLKVLAQQGPWSLINVPLLLSLSLAAFVPMGIRSAVRKWRGTVGEP
jgi:uncharacterized membrane protein YdjX (TVP38/TMEM64 family)